MPLSCGNSSTAKGLGAFLLRKTRNHCMYIKLTYIYINHNQLMQSLIHIKYFCYIFLKTHVNFQGNEIIFLQNIIFPQKIIIYSRGSKIIFPQKIILYFQWNTIIFPQKLMMIYSKRKKLSYIPRIFILYFPRKLLNISPGNYVIFTKKSYYIP